MNEQPCGNTACGCPVSKDQTFCSGECSTSRDSEGTCPCEHVTCRVAVDIEPSLYGDSEELEDR